MLIFFLSTVKQFAFENRIFFQCIFLVSCCCCIEILLTFICCLILSIVIRFNWLSANNIFFFSFPYKFYLFFVLTMTFNIILNRWDDSMHLTLLLTSENDSKCHDRIWSLLYWSVSVDPFHISKKIPSIFNLPEYLKSQVQVKSYPDFLLHWQQ